METPIFLYCLITIIFLTYFIISYLFKLLAITNIEKALQTFNGLLYLNLRHSIGILLFGITFLCLNPEYFKLLIPFKDINVSIMLAVVVIISLTIILARTSVKKTIRKYTGKVKVYHGNGIVYFSLRTVFLLAYELFFRGILLFALIDVFGLLLAIFINTAFYVLIHAFDSKDEIIGAIPFGIVLCLMSYLTQSVFFPFIIHLSLSLVYEVSLFKFLTTKRQLS